MSKLDESIARLTELNQKLAALLADDDGRGMATWCAFVSDVIAEMYVITASGAKHK